MRKIILASASERRSRILGDAGIIHSVQPSGEEEVTDDGRHVSDIVQANALLKAESVARHNMGVIVIGADTLVAHNDNILGKPANEDAARKMLKDFSGSKVEVYTGLAVIDTKSAKRAIGFDLSELYPVKLHEKRIEKFFRLMAPYDKAGGFSIEGTGSLLFDDIKGSYFNILGLPMIKLAELFEKAGLDIVDYIKR